MRLTHGLGYKMTKLLIHMQTMKAQQVVKEANVLLPVIPGKTPQRRAVHRLHRRAPCGKHGVEPIHHALRAVIYLAVQIRATPFEVKQCRLGRCQRQRVAHKGTSKIGDARFRIRIVTILPIATVQSI